MEEILVQGNITEDLKRLRVNATRTYGDENTSYQVYEVSEEDFQKLSDDADNRDLGDGHWKNGGWRWCEGSNQGDPNAEMFVNGEPILCWEKDREWKDDVYRDLLTYLCEEMGCSAFRNVCALAKDLAKYNNMKLAELFAKYQG